jgi:tetrahydromethanopterin S-methyltransferase subunit G
VQEDQVIGSIDKRIKKAIFKLYGGCITIIIFFLLVILSTGFAFSGNKLMAGSSDL